MTPLPKIFAVASAAGVVIGDMSAVAWAAIQSAPPPSLGDLVMPGATGAATSVAILWFWKGITDKRLNALEDRKADKSSMDDLSELLREMRGDIKTLMMRGNDHR